MLFAQLVSEIDISKYKKKQITEIILCKYWEDDLDLKNVTYSKKYSKLQKSMRSSKKDF